MIKIKKDQLEDFPIVTYHTDGPSKVVNSPTQVLRNEYGYSPNSYGLHRNGDKFRVHVKDIQHSPETFRVLVTKQEQEPNQEPNQEPVDPNRELEQEPKEKEPDEKKKEPAKKESTRKKAVTAK